mmetsp:Transcript_2543/g.4353  ORF Transcript_2543/g.4353 Transcript_2543/m.4353 type:complete len:569 (+) Transcript_2543:41-1747(+)
MVYNAAPLRSDRGFATIQPNVFSAPSAAMPAARMAKVISPGLVLEEQWGGGGFSTAIGSPTQRQFSPTSGGGGFSTAIGSSTERQISPPSPNKMDMPPPVGYQQTRVLGGPPQMLGPASTFAQVQTTSPTINAILQKQKSKPKAAVEYFSSSRGAWMPAIFEGFNAEYGTYTLDIKPFARPGDVRLAPGADVEYYSNSKGGWVPAQVIDFNEELRVYTLDVQPYARPDAVRIKGFEECLEPPNATCEPAEEPDVQAPTEAEIPAQPEVAYTVAMPAGLMQVDTLVEYFSSSKGDWVPATIIGYNEDSETYALDVRASALSCNIRVPKADSEVLSDETPIPQFNFEKYRTADTGEFMGFAGFIETATGARLRAFDEDVVAFERNCATDALKAWLEGIELTLFPGLLTFLQSEATTRHETLKILKQEKESYRGVIDYGFFGLDEEKCTEKDIDRAYRKKSRELHPDKGGNEEQFNEMQKMYEEIKEMRSKKDPEVKQESEKQETAEGDPLNWDPDDRESMLKAHDTFRSFLLWVMNDMTTILEELQELRRRFQAVTMKIEDAPPEAQEAA